MLQFRSFLVHVFNLICILWSFFYCYIFCILFYTGAQNPVMFSMTLFMSLSRNRCCVEMLRQLRCWKHWENRNNSNSNSNNKNKNCVFLSNSEEQWKIIYELWAFLVLKYISFIFFYLCDNIGKFYIKFNKQIVNFMPTIKF